MKIVTIISLVIFICGCKSHNGSIEKLGNKIDPNKAIVDSSFWKVERLITDKDTILLEEVNDFNVSVNNRQSFYFDDEYLFSLRIVPDSFFVQTDMQGMWRLLNDSLMYSVGSLKTNREIVNQIQNDVIELPIYNLNLTDTIGKTPIDKCIIKNYKLILVKNYFSGAIVPFLNRNKLFGIDTAYPFKINITHK
jgi:hypothetical protein